MPASRANILPAQSVEWETPPDLFDALDEEFGGFDLDPACRVHHHSAQRVLARGGMVYVPDDDKSAVIHLPDGRPNRDGLALPWHGRVFLNPPYGIVLRQWVRKAVEEVLAGNAVAEVVALLPVRTDTQWWQEYVGSGFNPHGHDAPRHHLALQDIRFVKGRLRFVGAGKDSATFSSAIVVWRLW